MTMILDVLGSLHTRPSGFQAELMRVDGDI